MAVARYFYDPNIDNFIGHGNPVFEFFYFPGNILFSALPILVGFPIILISFSDRPAFKKLQLYRNQALLLIFTILFGSGLLVSVGLKALFARPRPREVIQQGRAFYPPFQIAFEYWGESNTSFPCGHCSIAYALIAFYFAFNYAPKLWQKILKWGIGFAGTIVCGIIMALTRITFGAHFLSDAIWSFAFMYYSTLLFYYLLKIPQKEKIIHRFHQTSEKIPPFEIKDYLIVLLNIVITVFIATALIVLVYL